MPRPPNKTNFQLGEAGGVGRVGVGGGEGSAGALQDMQIFH